MVDRATALRDAATKRLSETKAEIKRLENEGEVLDHVSELFRRLIDREVTTGVKAVEKLQSEGLQTVFSDQDISAEAEVDVVRGKISVDLTTVHKRPDGSVIKGQSLDGFGGSVTTVQSVLLRIIVMIRRGLRPLLLLDEALPAFDADYIVNVGQFLKVLCDRLGIDILLVTHNQALVESVDNAYRIVRRPSGARFERIL
jgi:hypothetical protein